MSESIKFILLSVITLQVVTDVQTSSKECRSSTRHIRPPPVLFLFAGDVLELTCSIAPSEQVQWLKDGKSVQLMESQKFREPRNLVLGNGTSLTVRNLFFKLDSGNYTCIVKNGRCEEQYTTRVEVQSRQLSKPRLIVKPVNVSLFEGETAVLFCLAETNTVSGTVWFKRDPVNGLYLRQQNKEDEWLRLDCKQNDGNLYCNDTHLVIHKVSVKDVALYACEIFNYEGLTVGYAWISVNDGNDRLKARIASHGITFTVILVGSAVAVLIVWMVVMSLCYKYHDHKRIKRNRKTATSSIIWPHDAVGKRWQLDPTSIKIREQIGEGVFGRVFKGILHGRHLVAVKMPKESTTDKEIEDLIKEVSLMISLKQHDNLIQLLGCCWTKNGNFQVVMEYAMHGNLRNFLRAHKQEVICSQTSQLYKNVTHTKVYFRLCRTLLTDFCRQTAVGMEYLASLKIIHRDLAARNVLVAENGGNYVLKIADFGLTREVIANKDYYRHTLPGRLPIKWMSPESIANNIYTTKSDVWSFGIVLWEIFSYGDNPYPSIPAQNLLSLLKSGYRMPQPENASDSIYDIMIQCWLFDANDRPSFSELVICLEELQGEPTKVELHPPKFARYSRFAMVPDDNANLSYDATMSQSDSPLLHKT